jgi:hypothetical protein
VEQAKSGDGEGRDQSYPKCFLMGENFQVEHATARMVDGKQGMIQDPEQNGRFFPGDHRMMHRAAGITKSSRLCLL